VREHEWKAKTQGKGRETLFFHQNPSPQASFLLSLVVWQLLTLLFLFFFYFLFFSSGNSAKGQKIAAKVEEVLEKKRKQPEVSSDDFPRGGASGLTPLEYKEIKLQVDAELFKVRKREEERERELNFPD